MSHGNLIKDLPAGERPRERLAALGSDALRNAELIAILLRTGLKGISAIQVADNLQDVEHFQVFLCTNTPLPLGGLPRLRCRDSKRIKVNPS